jgi:hypothetical protein
MRRRRTMYLTLLVAAAATVVTVVLAQAIANDPDIEGYHGWTRLNPQRNFIESPHAAPKDVYVNDVGRAAALDGQFPFAEGSVMVKESTNVETLAVEAITVMRKVAGFDPDNGDWQYAMFERQEDGAMDGMWFGTDHEMHAMCVGCHVAAAETDYAFLNYMGD